MTNPKSHIPLPEEDHLAIHEFNRHLYQCETRRDFKEFILKSLLPWFNCDMAASGWMNMDLKAKNLDRPKVIDCVGIPENEYEVVEKRVPYNRSFLNLFATTTRSALAIDVDIPRETFAREIDQFYSDHPQYDRNKLSYGKLLATVVCMERPDLNFVFGMSRYAPNEQPFTRRDLRRLELLQPSLIHAIKVIALNVELQTYKALVENMAEAEAPLALIRKDHRVLFTNSSFKQLLPLEPGRPIPSDLVEMVEREARYLRADHFPQIPEPRMAFYHLPQGSTFRVGLTHLNRPHDEADRSFLIRLHSTADPLTRLSLDLHHAGLTPREMETVLLVKDGFDDGEISQRLFISFNTVRNHLKAIHKKLKVQSRQKLMAFLHSHK